MACQHPNGGYLVVEDERHYRVCYICGEKTLLSPCTHEYYEILEQQGFVIARCTECGYERLKSEIKKGNPRKEKKLLSWAPWRLFRTNKNAK